MGQSKWDRVNGESEGICLTALAISENIHLLMVAKYVCHLIYTQVLWYHRGCFDPRGSSHSSKDMAKGETFKASGLDGVVLLHIALEPFLVEKTPMISGQ